MNKDIKPKNTRYPYSKQNRKDNPEKEEPIIHKYDERKDINSKETPKDEPIIHNYTNNKNNKNDKFLNNITLKKKKESSDVKMAKKKKFKKIDKNILILIGVFYLLCLLIFLKTTDQLMTILTLAGITIIILFSYILKIIRRNKVVRIITNILTVFILLCCIAGVCGVAYFGYNIVKSAPDWNIQKLDTIEKSIIYNADGSVKYAELGSERREKITYDKTSENLINAVIATEDSRFFQHNGFDPIRFFKASIGQLRGNPNAGGASTLSMQIIKNQFTNAYVNDFNDEGIKRKFTDIYLAVFKLEKEYTKQEILEFYINNHTLGNNSYGVEQASQTYFGKSASHLTLAEASLLAGIYQATDSYNPFLHPDKATFRRGQVLNLMYNHGYITAEERDLANAIPVESLLASKPEKQKYQAYIETVVQELQDQWHVNPFTTSLKIYTNIDFERQQGLEDIFDGKTFKWENKVVLAGIAAVDVHSGKILAIRGDRSDEAYSINYATKAVNQIGSTAKPLFDYGPGMEYNGWSTYTLFEDEKHYYSSGQEIRNSDRKYMGTLTLREALAHSRNVPALKAFQAVDNDKIYDFVTNLGIKPETKNGDKYLHEAHSIGAFNSTSPLQMAAAYAAFANGGIYYEPYTVSKIVYRDTGETVEYEPEEKRAMSDSTAYMMTYALRYAVTNGLSSGAAIKGINVAAKTGTTNFTEDVAKKNNLPSYAVKDAWIVGYDPDTAVAMWYGYDKIYDGKTGYFLKSASSGFKVNITTERNRLYQTAGKVLFKSKGKDFKVPNSVVKVAVEKGTDPAKLASSATPKDKVTYEYFKKGTEPTEVSSAYIKQSNVSDLKATYNIYAESVSLTWSGVGPNGESEESYGRFGYKIYKDNKYLGFTTDTSYTVKDQPSPIGTYKVVTCYEDYGDTASSGVTVKITENDIDTATYTAELVIPGGLNYTIGAQVDSCLTNGQVSSSCAILYRDGEPVSDHSISVTIKNSNNENSDIDTSIDGTYTVTFDISYNNKKRVTKIVNVTIE